MELEIQGNPPQAPVTGEESEEGAEEEDEEEEVNPLLFVDVNLGPGLSSRIVVFEGDTAEDLADKFATEHGLDGNTKEKLT